MPYQDLGLESNECSNPVRQMPGVKQHGGVAAGQRVAVSEVAMLPLWSADCLGWENSEALSLQLSEATDR